MNPLLRVAIAGRPNVGKSTLFNRLVGRKLAIVHDTPGVTRDWQESPAELFGQKFTIIDTAGLDEGQGKTDLTSRMSQQSFKAISQAELILLMVDGTAGLLAEDRRIAQNLRKSGKPIMLLVNKCDKKSADSYEEFYRLGFAVTLPISAAQGQGLDGLAAHLADFIPASDDAMDEAMDKPLKIAVVGKPNAGKSTLINKILGQERLLTGPEAGITRDAIATMFRWQNKTYELVDTAGLRKKSRVVENLEQMATSDTIQALNFAEVVLLVLDVSQGITHQDLTIAQLASEEGRAVILLINKWDLVKTKKETKASVEAICKKSIPQLSGLPILYISALHNSNIEPIFKAIDKIYLAWNSRISTGKLNSYLRKVVEAYPPPIVKNRRLKLRYATQIKARPPRFVLFVNDNYNLPASYERYLVNKLRQEFHLDGVPIRIFLRQGENPYAEKE
jgi:GTPase